MEGILSSARNPVAPAAGGEPNNRLRVLHVILSRGFAGSERAAAESCAALAGRHDVALVVRSDHRDRLGVSLLDHLEPGIQVFEVPPHWRTQSRLAQIVEQWRPDVIHTHLRRGTRYITRTRHAARHVSTLHLHLNGPHYLRTDALFCISDWQLATVPATYAGQVHLVPNSLVPHPKLAPERVRQIRAELGAGDDDFLIGAVGRLVPRKGFDVLLRAFAAAQLPHARLVLVGDGSERRSLEQLATGAVHFTGYRRDVKDLYQAFDLFVCPSRYEPFGRVIAEALDGGVPVVAADAQGPRDIAQRYPLELVPIERRAAAHVSTAASPCGGPSPRRMRPRGVQPRANGRADGNRIPAGAGRGSAVDAGGGGICAHATSSCAAPSVQARCASCSRPSPVRAARAN